MKQPKLLFIIFIFLILFSVIKSKWDSLNQFKQKEKMLQTEIQSLEKQTHHQETQQIVHEKTTSKVVDGLQFALQNGLVIKQWRHSSEVIEVEVLGLFSQEINFLQHLLKASLSIQALDWQIQKDELLLLKIKYIRLPNRVEPRLSHQVLHQKNLTHPFRSQLLNSKLMSHQHHLDSITMLHHVGMWQTPHEKIALLAWPDHCIELVTLGQLIAKERAKITAINRHYIALRVANNHKDILIWSP